eukprot:scaffold20991_cov15-Tisochrysis_lutea.AAC.1
MTSATRSSSFHSHKILIPDTCVAPYDPSVVPPVLRDMVLFTEKSEGKDVWPYGIDWLDAAYSTPYFVTKQAEERAAQEAKAGWYVSQGSQMKGCKGGMQGQSQQADFPEMQCV